MTTYAQIPSCCRILDIGRATVGIIHDPGEPEITTGHPDNWSPSFGGGIEMLYVLLRSRNAWVSVDPEDCPQIDAFVARLAREGA